MQKKRIVISGINGFVGHHLARELVANNVSVIGIGTDSSISSSIEDIVEEYYSQDLIAGWPPIDNIDGIIHLAGLASVGPSFNDPQRYIGANSAMMTHLCEYYLPKANRPRILAVSSSTVYSPDQPMPIAEETARLGFNSPYAVSKMVIENQASYYRNRGLDCIIARPFNHTGPEQGSGFILPDLFEKLTKLNPDTTLLKVGNIHTKRDYTDVRDIVNAYRKLILAPTLEHTVYNICSGISLSGEDLLNTLKGIIDKDDVQFEIDQSLVRPTDPAEFFGDPSRLQNELGWKLRYSIETTIKDFITTANTQG